MSKAGNGAVALVSGGLDSATTLAIALSEGFEVYALTLDYGQRHKFELEAAERVASTLGAAEHLVMNLDLRQVGGSALTDEIEVPKSDPGGDIPVTYVPARNTILLSLALAWAESLGAWDIFIGANAVDFSGYPDCRPRFIDAFQRLANAATAAAAKGLGQFEIHAPLIDKRKSEIIQTGMELGVDFGLTLSCYDPLPEGLACGRCDSCRLRLRGFAEAGLEDPAAYAERGEDNNVEADKER